MKCWKKDKQNINDFREYLHDLEVKSGLFESLPATETLRHFTSSHNYRVCRERVPGFTPYRSRCDKIYER